MAFSLRAIAPASMADWLAIKTLRERRILAAIAILAALVLMWSALWQPLVRDAAAMRAVQANYAAEIATARRMTEEIPGLARNTAPSFPDARAALERIFVQQNLRPAVTQIDWQDGRARIVFAAVGYDSLIVALEALQRDAKLRPVEITVTTRIEPGVVRAELTLAR